MSACEIPYQSQVGFLCFGHFGTLCLYSCPEACVFGNISVCGGVFIGWVDMIGRSECSPCEIEYLCPVELMFHSTLLTAIRQKSSIETHFDCGAKPSGG